MNIFWLVSILALSISSLSTINAEQSQYFTTVDFRIKTADKDLERIKDGNEIVFVGKVFDEIGGISNKEVKIYEKTTDRFLATIYTNYDGTFSHRWIADSLDDSQPLKYRIKAIAYDRNDNSVNSNFISFTIIPTQNPSKLQTSDSERQNDKFCFFNWCFENIFNYFIANKQGKDIESKANEIINTVASDIAQLPQNLPQINSNNVELEKLKQTNLQQQVELEQKQQELQKLQEIKSQQQEQLELEKQQREQERQDYENRIEAEKREKIEALASKYPIIKGIMSGTIHYYIEPVPDYALPEINLEVVPQIEQMLQSQSSVDVPFQRVYEKSSADFVVTWKRDIGTHLGNSWRYFNEVGLGSSTCWEDWVPFDSRTVKRITWHEIGHAVGFWHSQDTSNVMYESTDDRNIYEIDQSYALDEGSSKLLKFCESGSYRISIESSQDDHGFEMYLIPSSEDPNNFHKGKYYSNCSTDREYLSWTEDCSVKAGDYLIVYNPNDLLKFSAIDVSVKIVDIRERDPINSKWDPTTFHWFDQSLMREVLANYMPAH